MGAWEVDLTEVGMAFAIQKFFRVLERNKAFNRTLRKKKGGRTWKVNLPVLFVCLFACLSIYPLSIYPFHHPSVRVHSFIYLRGSDYVVETWLQNNWGLRRMLDKYIPVWFLLYFQLKNGYFSYLKNSYLSHYVL